MAPTPVSFYNKLFPPTRNRAKELEAAERFVRRVPAYMGSVAMGYKPGWITSSMILCPAVFEYTLADWMVPYLYAWGVDTPNKVTLLNCFTVRLASLFCVAWAGGDNGLGWYWVLAVLLVLQLVFDAADGQMARRYGLGSDFGAWLDATTDNIYGICFGTVSLCKTAIINDGWLPVIILCLIFLQMASCGNYFIQANQQNLHWKNQMNILHKLGTYQMLFSSYYYLVLITTYMYLGWWH